MNSRSTLPAINSYEFKRLPFRQQLYILSVYMENKDKYRELTGASDIPIEGLEYLDTDTKKIVELQNEPLPPANSRPISFIGNYWACYHCQYNPKWFDDMIVTPLDVLGISYRRILGINFFNFPLLVMDKVAREIMAWIHSSQKSMRADILYYTAWMRAAAGTEYDKVKFSCMKDHDLNDIMSDIWDVASEHRCTSVDEINELYPTVDDSEDLVIQVEDETYMLSIENCCYVDTRRVYLPLLPTELLQYKISLKGWELLQADTLGSCK